MPVKKRATTPPQFAELLQCFPCPAWIEDSSGGTLARNARKVMGASCSQIREQDAPTTLNPIAYPLPSNLRLVALFPAAQETNCQHDIISALLAKILQPRQPDAPDLTRLTPREREIYRKLSQGHSYKIISEHLGISHEAVRQHIVRMRRKLGDAHIPLLRQRKAKTAAETTPKPPSLKVT